MYTPLNPTLNQIRLIRFPPAPRHQTVVTCGIDVVSLDSTHPSSPGGRVKHPRSWNDLNGLNGLNMNNLDIFSHSVDWREQRLEQPALRPPNPPTRRHPYRYTWGDFEALSYTWGEEAERVDILMNGRRTSVPRNLERALQALRNLEETKPGMRYWVDYLCIDQENHTERIHQVKLMKDIFTQARAVVVWLGEEEEADWLAVKVMYQLCRNPCLEARYFLSPHLIFDGWHAIQHFAQKSYWSRTWIVQELALNHHSTLFLCGRHKLTRRMIRLGASFSQHLVRDIQAYSITLKEPVDPDAWTHATRMHRLVSLNSLSNNEGDLDKILQLVRKADAADARDKVYGILGLLGTASLSSIEPDYSLSVQQVYTEFIRTILSSTGRLEHILFGGLAREGWSSWVPDWTQPFQRRHFRYLRASRASLSLPGNFSFSKQGDISILICRGFVVDKVQAVGTLGPHELSTCDATPGRYGDDTANALDRTLSLDHPGMSRRVSVLKVPWTEGRASGCLDTPNKQTTSTPLEKFNRFRDANAGFRFGNKTFKDHFPYRRSSYTAISPHVDNVNLHLLSLSLEGRQLFTTETGYLGSAPDNVLPNDIIAILLGCSCPVVLRECEDGLFAIVGECYVHGIMKGEFLNGVESAEQRDFCLR